MGEFILCKIYFNKDFLNCLRNLSSTDTKQHIRLFTAHSQATGWINCATQDNGGLATIKKKEEERYKLRIHGVIFQVTLLSRKARFKSVYRCYLLYKKWKKRILHNFCKNKHRRNKPEPIDNDYIWGRQDHNGVNRFGNVTCLIQLFIWYWLLSHVKCFNYSRLN